METESDNELKEPYQENSLKDVEPPASEELRDTASDSTTDDEYNHVESFDGPILEVGPQAITVAHSIVKTCLSQIGHVRYINIRAWLRGFRVKIANFSSFLCPSIPKRDLGTKKTTPNIEV